MNRGGRGPRRPFYRYPNPGYGGYHDGGGYNFSSDVNVDNTGGAFVYGSGPPPQMHYHQPHYGGGGYRPPFHGFRGGGGHYPPPQFGFRQRGFRPPNFRGGRFPRQGYRGGRGGPRPQKPRNNDNEEPYYHPSMFEDPWRFLLPQEKAEEKTEGEPSKETAAEETGVVKEVADSSTAEGEGTDTNKDTSAADNGADRTIGDPETAETVAEAAETVTAAAEKAEDEPPSKQKSECSIDAEPGSNGHVLVTEDSGEKEAKTEAGGEIVSSSA